MADTRPKALGDLLREKGNFEALLEELLSSKETLVLQGTPLAGATLFRHDTDVSTLTARLQGLDKEISEYCKILVQTEPAPAVLALATPPPFSTPTQPILVPSVPSPWTDPYVMPDLSSEDARVHIGSPDYIQPMRMSEDPRMRIFEPSPAPVLAPVPVAQAVAQVAPNSGPVSSISGPGWSAVLDRLELLEQTNRSLRQELSTISFPT
jgi:hypothetical protein